MGIIKHSQRIVPFLWYDGKAEEAINLYTSLFPNSRINEIQKWPEGGPFPAGQVQMGSFILDGVAFYAFDAGPQFKFSEAISFFVHCKDQEEVDHYWNRLTADGGKEEQCGWLKDKFGISWQIIPEYFIDKMYSGEPAKMQSMVQAMMQMRKFDISKLEEAFNKG